MRILIFEQRYTRSNEAGISRFNLLIKRWAEVGHRITIISGMVNYISGKKPEKYRGKLFVKERENNNITVVRVFDSLPGYRTFLGRLLSYFVFMELACLAGLFVRKPDVIIASSPPIFVGVVAHTLSFLKHAPFVFEVRDLWPDVAVELGFLKNHLLIKLSHLLENFLYKRAVFIIVNSPGLKKFLVEEKRVSGEKVGVVLNPLDFNLAKNYQASRTRKKMGWNDKFVVIYSGAHSAVYDFDTVFDVAKELSKNSPILFVLVGDGRQKPHLVKRVRKEKISNILLLPPVSKAEVINLVASADVGIVSLKKMRLLRYVYATKILDYMIARKPIVLAMEGVSADLVCGKARCGICIPPGDREELKKAILELFNDSEKRRNLGEKGYNFARENFSADVLAALYLDLLKPVIIPKRKGD